MDTAQPMPLRLKMVCIYAYLQLGIAFLVLIVGKLASIGLASLTGTINGPESDVELGASLAYLDAVMAYTSLINIQLIVQGLILALGAYRTGRHKPFGWSLLAGPLLFGSIWAIGLQQVPAFRVSPTTIQHAMFQQETQYAGQLINVPEDGFRGGELPGENLKIPDLTNVMLGTSYLLPIGTVLIVCWLFLSRKTLAYYGWTFPPKSELRLGVLFGLLIGLIVAGTNALVFSEISKLKPCEELLATQVGETFEAPGKDRVRNVMTGTHGAEEQR